MTVPRETPELTVYFDGSCPLCRAEMRHYGAEDGAGSICFVDVSRTKGDLAGDLTRGQALARFHVRRSNGALASGAAAFVAVWQLLPRWQWAARVAALPGMMATLDFGYRLFLPVRPLLSWLVGTFQGLGGRGTGSKGS
jgi:predicted DCC family thiol-disulfide oxidoreductase YuxK